MKLHLPKMFLAAVLTAMVSVPASATMTGWGEDATVGGKKARYYIDTQTPTDPIDATADNVHTSYIIVADVPNIGEVTVSELKAKAGDTVSLAENPWAASQFFNPLVLNSVVVADNGGINLSQVSGSAAVIKAVTGSLSSVSNAGTLTIGADSSSSTAFGGTIVNTGTMTVNGAVSITGLEGFTIVGEGGITWSDATNNQGYKTTSSNTYLLSSGGVTYTDATTLTYNGQSADIAVSDGNATFVVEGSVTGTIYFINNEDTTINTGDETGATGFSLAGGTSLNVNSAIGADGIAITGADASISVASGLTLNSSQLSFSDGATAHISLDGAIFNVNQQNPGTGVSSIELSNGAGLKMSDAFGSFGTEENKVSINMSGDSYISLFNGNTWDARNLWADILVDGNARIGGSHYGNASTVRGTIAGAGTLSLVQMNSTNNYTVASTISDGTGEGDKLAVSVNLSEWDTTNDETGETTHNYQAVNINGANTYSGGTTITSGEVNTGNESALGTGKVTMNGGKLTQSTALSVTAMDYTSGTVNNNGQNLTVTGKLTAAADMSIEGAGTTSIGSLDLSAGTRLSAAGSLTIGELVLDLSKYTEMAQTYTLVTTTGTDATVGLTTAYSTEYNGYTATVSGSGTNSLTLSFSEIVAPGGPITTTVLGQDGFADGMLTLNVDGNLTDATQVFITGISDGIMAEILGLSGLPADGMVGITLQGAEGGTFTATADQQIGFQGKDGGIYFGEQVGTNWQYQVAYIPEPASATLGLAALMMLAARRRRKA